MGTLTYSDFKTYLKVRFGNADSWDSYYGVWVNQAYKYVCSLDVIPGTRVKIVLPDLDKAASQNSTSGTTYITTPSDCLIVNEVYDNTNEKRLDWFPYRSYVRKTDTDTSTAYSKPSYWVRRGSYIFLYPTPDGTYSISVDYRRLPTSMSSDSDTSELRTEWDSIILELAVWIGREWSNEPERADRAKKNALEMMLGIASIYNNEERARDEKLRPETSFLAATRGQY